MAGHSGELGQCGPRPFAVNVMRWLRCLWRQQHNPTRHPLGGFRCSECGTAGADLEAMGFEGSSYVAPWRLTYSRKHGELTRSEW